MASNDLHVLKLESIHTAGHQLNVRYRYDEYRFSSSFWYDFDLKSTEEMYGVSFMENIYFQCAAFDMIKFCSLKPTVIDWGSYVRWHTQDFEHVWRKVEDKVSSQWRYENDLLHRQQPRFASQPTTASCPVEITGDESCSTLALFGGGKDSLVVLELLSKASITFSTLTCSFTEYGQAVAQYGRSRGLLDVLSTQSTNHQLSVIDDFQDSPVLASLGKKLGIKTSFAAPTPLTLLAALPIMLHYGYTDIVIGNEHSANDGNLVWKESGEEVNHQWGKSKEAEILLHDYIQKALIRNVSYFSILQPIHDPVIVHIAGSRPEAIVHSYSCNLLLSWCLRCPKCCYVWLCFMAYLPHSLVDTMFHGQNLLDITENEMYFTEMIGLGTKKPFECIGEINEAKLAFELCRHKGIQGRAMDIYKEKVLPSMTQVMLSIVIEKYTTVHPLDAALVPGKFRDRLSPLLEQYGKQIREKLETLLLLDA